MVNGTLYITGDPEADALLNSDPLGLLIGMLLDQQVPMEWAFAGPARLAERLGGALDAETIAAIDPDSFAATVGEKPALHRFPSSMAERIQQMCAHVVSEYGGNAEKLWLDVESGADLHERLVALPGYGAEKARIFVAILAKRFGVKPAGWEQAAGPFADSAPRSVADISDAESLAVVRAWKKQQKAKGKTKAE